MGDIHGHFHLLRILLQQLEFKTSSDRLFITGDVIDRGPHSKHILELFSYPWFHSVRGNHEQMIIDSMEGRGDQDRHSRNGGAWFYDLDATRREEVYSGVCHLPIAIEIAQPNGETVGIVHAEPPGWQEGCSWQDSIDRLHAAKAELREKSLSQALYSRLRLTQQDRTVVRGVDRVYVGHSTVKELTRLGNTVYIDTGCSFADGKLSVLEINSKLAFSCPTGPENDITHTDPER